MLTRAQTNVLALLVLTGQTSLSPLQKGGVHKATYEEAFRYLKTKPKPDIESALWARAVRACEALAWEVLPERSSYRGGIWMVHPNYGHHVIRAHKDGECILCEVDDKEDPTRLASLGSFWPHKGAQVVTHMPDPDVLRVLHLSPVQTKAAHPGLLVDLIPRPVSCLEAQALVDELIVRATNEGVEGSFDNPSENPLIYAALNLLRHYNRTNSDGFQGTLKAVVHIENLIYP